MLDRWGTLCLILQGNYCAASFFFICIVSRKFLRAIGTDYMIEIAIVASCHGNMFAVNQSNFFLAWLSIHPLAMCSRRLLGQYVHWISDWSFGPMNSICVTFIIKTKPKQWLPFKFKEKCFGLLACHLNCCRFI